MPDELRKGAFGDEYIKHDDGSISYVREGMFGRRWIDHPDGTWSDFREGFGGQQRLDHSDGSTSYLRDDALGNPYVDHGHGDSTYERGSSAGSTQFLEHTEEDPSYFHRSGFSSLFEASPPKTSFGPTPEVDEDEVHGEAGLNRGAANNPGGSASSEQSSHASERGRTRSKPDAERDPSHDAMMALVMVQGILAAFALGAIAGTVLSVYLLAWAFRWIADVNTILAIVVAPAAVWATVKFWVPLHKKWFGLFREFWNGFFTGGDTER